MKCSSTKLALTESSLQMSFQPEHLRRFVQWICFVFAFNSSLAQNVGIGVDIPTQKLDVAGNIKGINLYSSGSVGIGTTLPTYKLHIYDGSLGITNTADNATWTFGYSAVANGLLLSENSSSKVTFLNSGNVGIGNTAPAYKLDVNGNIHAETNAVIDGNVTVNNGKGILQNSQGAAQLKYYTRTAAFTAILPGFGLSAEGGIGFTPGIFTSPPTVYVGDIVSTGGTVGELFRVQLIIYEVTTTGCKARLLNTSPNAVNYGITWNIVCIGD